MRNRLLPALAAPFAALCLILFSGVAFAQANCHPAPMVEQYLAAFERRELGEAERVAFTAEFNAIPPETHYPAPARIILAADRRALLIVIAHPAMEGMLCGVAVDRRETVDLVRKYLGAGA